MPSNAFGPSDVGRLVTLRTVTRAGPADPDAVVAGVMLTDGASAVDRLAAYRAAGADLPVVYPVPVLDAPSSIMSTMLAVAPSPVLQP